MRARDAMTCLKLPQMNCVAPELRFTAEVLSVAMVRKGYLEGDRGCERAIKDVDA